MKVENSRIKVKKMRAKLKLDMLSGFKKPPVVPIPEIPEERTLFPGTTNDFWVSIKTDENKTSCLYELDSKGFFSTHYHEHENEVCTLITPNSKVEWITEEGIFEYEYPASFEVDKKIKHALVNLSAFPIKFRVDWYPKMKEGWDANFIKK